MTDYKTIVAAHLSRIDAYRRYISALENKCESQYTRGMITGALTIAGIELLIFFAINWS